MAWPTPRFSKSEINKAGSILVSSNPPPEDHNWAQEVLTNWRACHGYPINTFQATLRQKLRHVDTNALVAQRLKRAPTIVDKLTRYPKMKLARMQDIGGLRAVMSTIEQVRKLESDYRNSRFKHKLVNSQDYLTHPKADGYRSIHLIYRYKNDRAPAYDGLQLELQIRTKLQHAWATAVETMGTFLGQALKSRQGDQQWLSFFEITGSAFAHLENSPLVPGYEMLSRQQTYEAVAQTEADLGVLNKLTGFSVAMNAISTDQKRGSYHLIVLNSASKTVAIKTYSLNRLEEASEAYAEVEAKAAEGDQIEAVLVSAGPIDQLRRAYPNYFLDTNDFINRVRSIIKSSKRMAKQA